MKYRIFLMFQPVALWWRDLTALAREPVRVVLYASVWRVRWFGIFAIFGNILFYILLNYQFSQKFESLILRSIGVLIGIIVLYKSNEIILENGRWKWFYFLALFFQLPLFFLIMAELNHFNTVWIGACAIMVMLYYQGTDWRLATLGIVIGIIIALGFHLYIGAFSMKTDLKVLVIVFVFAWVNALAIALSSANLHKQQLLNTAYTLGVMAHELRTPMAGIAIIHSVLVQKNKKYEDPELILLNNKLHNFIKTIHHHINSQIANVKLTEINQTVQTVNINYLLSSFINSFPFPVGVEKSNIRVLAGDAFSIKVSPVLFTQVLNNLTQNALKAMAMKELDDHEKIITLRAHQVSQINGTTLGCITVSDNGIGIKPEYISKVFEPFFSTNTAIGHGLGLSYCKKVITAYKGKLAVSSVYGSGTTITIYLPIAQPINTP